MLKRQRNARVLLAEVDGLRPRAAARSCSTRLPNGDAAAARSPYDTLVVAGGSRYSYFGHDEWREHAPELKSLDGALDIRDRILRAFEAAEVEPDPRGAARWLTFVVVGGGPTGVEMAGQIAELARDTLRRDFRAVDTRTARVLLVEARRPRARRASRESLSRKAARALERLGVTRARRHTVVDVTPTAVTIRDPAAASSSASRRAPSSGRRA